MREPISTPEWMQAPKPMLELVEGEPIEVVCALSKAVNMNALHKKNRTEDLLISDKASGWSEGMKKTVENGKEMLEKWENLLAKTENMFYYISIINLFQGCLGESESF